MTDKSKPEEQETTVPASGLFGRRSAVPADLGNHRRDSAHTLFGKRAAEAA